MTITEYHAKATDAVKKKLKAGALIAVIHTGRKREGATEIPQRVDKDGDPLVRFISPKLVVTFEEFGWRKAAIPKEPVSNATEQAGDMSEDPEPAKRGRKKNEV